MKMKQILKYSLISGTLLSAYEANAWNPFKKKESSPEQKIRKKAEDLFPPVMTMGCSAKLAQPFNPIRLAEYISTELKIVVNAKGTKDKKKALEGVNKVKAYIKKLDKCALNAQDPKFNGVISSKFLVGQGQRSECSTPPALLQITPRGSFGKMDVSQIYRTFIDSVYDLQDRKSLCSKVMATKGEVGKIQRIAELNKELGIPSGIKAKPMYLGFSQDLTKPLTYAGANNKLLELFRLDQKGFTQHFNRLLKGITSSNGKTKNPKAVDQLAQGCKGELQLTANKIPLIGELCRQALKTDAQNENNKKVSQWKKELGVPGNASSAFAHYKIFDTGLVKNWTQPDAAEKLVAWYKIDSEGAMKHLNMILKGVKGDGKKTLNPNSTKLVVEACNGEMNERVQTEIPVMQKICEAARKTHSTNDTNAEIAGYKKELGIGAASSLMLKTCSPKFLQKLNHEVAAKWVAVDPAGVSEYLGNIAKCFKGQAVKNPKMAHYIEEKCNAGLATIPGAEELCGKASDKVQQFNNEASEELMKGMEGMVDEGSDHGPSESFSGSFEDDTTQADEEISSLFGKGDDIQGTFLDDSDSFSSQNMLLSPEEGSDHGPSESFSGSFENDTTQAHQPGLNPHAESWSLSEGSDDWSADNKFGQAQSAQFDMAEKGPNNWDFDSGNDLQYAESTGW